jgi:hypothetical protein
MGSSPSAYEQKFPALIELCRQTKPEDMIIVANPHTLGHTYDELIESLERLGDARLHLVIVTRSERSDAG